jgi:uncharacterized membrane protein YcaP (DUF421 family)
MFVPSVSPFEVILRGSIMYLSLFVMLRLILKRQFGTFGLTDLLLIVLLADAAQNGMSGEYHSICDGLLLVGTLIFWNYVLDYLGHKSKLLERFIYPPPLKLIDNGRMIRRNMRKEFITEAELLSQLREQGVEGAEDVKLAFMEGDGAISVIRKDHGESSRTATKSAP